MKPLDTTDRAYQMQVDVFRGMGPEKRLRAGLDLTRISWKLLEEGIKLRHPDYDKGQVRLAAIRIRLGEELYLSVYPEAADILP